MNPAQILAGTAIIVGAFFLGFKLGSPPEEYTMLLDKYRAALDSIRQQAHEIFMVNRKLTDANRRIAQLERSLPRDTAGKDKILA